MKKYWIVNIIMMIMLAGCAFSSSRLKPAPNSANEQMTTNIAIERTKTITTDAPNNSPLPTNNKDQSLKNQTPTVSDGEQCQLPILELPNSVTDLEGTLVLKGQDFSSTNWNLFDIATREEIQLPNLNNPYIFDAAVSHNGEWLAYVASSHPYKDDLLFVLNSNGKVEQQYPLAASRSKWPAEGHDGFVGWIDNDRLLVSYGNYPGADAISLVLNPFTGDWQTFFSDYPNLFTTVKTSPFWGNYSVTLAVFHPSLGILVYPSYEGLVLWDLRTKKAISILPDDNFLVVNEPVWSPDGGSFVIDLFSSRTDPQKLSNRNIFQIFPNGELIQLTSYSNRNAGDFVDYSWSPDSKSIAFWIIDSSDESKPSYKLAILDITSNLVKELCIRADIGVDDFPRSSPVWSQNSKYIAVAATSDNPKEASQAIIISLADNIAYKLEADVYPVGWMK